MKKRKNYPNRQCESSKCTNLVDTDYDLLLKDNGEKVLRQRYCKECTRNIREELARKEWRDELGIG
jgi:hypothetical protein